MKDIIAALKKKLIESARKNRANGLLFSGGLDSSILAAINPGIKAITVSLKSGGEDVRYSNLATKFFNIKYFSRSVGVGEAIEAIPEVIKILKTFDPAIPNDLVVYFGVKKAKELGLKDIMVGDGSDELFAGYDFMQEINDLPSYIEKISKKMSFSSNEIGRAFGINIAQPYMDKEIVDLALQIPVALKIKKEGAKIYGKWVLRKAFSDILPNEIIWQGKRPLEYGSGMTGLRKIISNKISDDEFSTNPYDINFMNKEHMYYYKIYRNVVGAIPRAEKGEKKCPGCGGGMKRSAYHCKICGYVNHFPPTRL